MIARCQSCGGVARTEALHAALVFEQIKHYVRELALLGVPDDAIDPLREWARSLRRCSCDDLSFEI